MEKRRREGCWGNERGQKKWNIGGGGWRGPKQENNLAGRKVCGGGLSAPAGEDVVGDRLVRRMQFRRPPWPWINLCTQHGVNCKMVLRSFLCLNPCDKGRISQIRKKNLWSAICKCQRENGAQGSTKNILERDDGGRPRADWRSQAVLGSGSMEEP